MNFERVQRFTDSKKTHIVQYWCIFIVLYIMYFSIIYRSLSFRVLFKYCTMNQIICKLYIFNEIRLFSIFDNRILKYVYNMIYR